MQVVEQVVAEPGGVGPEQQLVPFERGGWELLERQLDAVDLVLGGVCPGVPGLRMPASASCDPSR